tara:strand:+ start:502 stop:891 length:390 start_codon:yes stop_codon:yes gene_type:complete
MGTAWRPGCPRTITAGLGTRTLSWLEALYDLGTKLGANKATYARQLAVLFPRDQRHSVTFLATATGPANTVDVVFRVLWHVKVDHERQVVDIDTASGNVCGNQRLDRFALELGQSLGACSLAFITVDSC